MFESADKQVNPAELSTKIEKLLAAEGLDDESKKGLQWEISEGHVVVDLRDKFGDVIDSVPEFQKLTGTEPREGTSEVDERTRERILEAIKTKVDNLINDFGI
jgi:hypothetical protein